MKEESTNNFMFLFNKELTERERIFKLSSAILTAEEELVIRFICNADLYDEILTEELRYKVDDIVRKIVPKGFLYQIYYEKSITSIEYIERLVMEFIYSDSPLVFPKLKSQPISVELNYNQAIVKMILPPFLYSFMTTSGIDKRLSNFLDGKIIESVELSIVSGNSVDVEIKKKKRRQIKPDALKTVSVEVTEKLIGSIAKLPRCIVDIASIESEARTICGKVSALNKIISKKTEKAFFTFFLNDTTGSMQVKYFPYDGEKASFFEENIKNDDEIIVEGPVRFDSYSKEFALTLKKAALCKIDLSSVSEKTYNEVDEDYITIEPKPFNDEEQFDMFNQGTLPTELCNTTYVVFDLETTGLSPSADKIIEIGAVKMQNGFIVEEFSTLIDPEIKIPPSASAINNIYDKDVEGCPKWSDVVGDFYKFTRDAVLVGQNVGFDQSFLVFHGEKEGYNFDNKTLDTLQMARNLLMIKSYKLESLCKELGVELLNAHRALHDAVATARVFKKLIIKNSNKKAM